MEACAAAVGARRGREGNLVRTLIRTNGWRKVVRSAETRQKTVDEAEKEEKKKFRQGHYWMDKRDESFIGESTEIPELGDYRVLGVRPLQEAVWRERR